MFKQISTAFLPHKQPSLCCRKCHHNLHIVKNLSPSVPSSEQQCFPPDDKRTWDVGVVLCKFSIPSMLENDDDDNDHQPTHRLSHAAVQLDYNQKKNLQDPAALYSLGPHRHHRRRCRCRRFRAPVCIFWHRVFEDWIAVCLLLFCFLFSPVFHCSGREGQLEIQPEINFFHYEFNMLIKQQAPRCTGGRKFKKSEETPAKAGSKFSFLFFVVGDYYSKGCVGSSREAYWMKQHQTWMVFFSLACGWGELSRYLHFGKATHS